MSQSSKHNTQPTLPSAPNSLPSVSNEVSVTERNTRRTKRQAPGPGRLWSVWVSLRKGQLPFERAQGRLIWRKTVKNAETVS